MDKQLREIDYIVYDTVNALIKQGVTKEQFNKVFLKRVKEVFPMFLEEERQKTAEN